MGVKGGKIEEKKGAGVELREKRRSGWGIGRRVFVRRLIGWGRLDCWSRSIACRRCRRRRRGRGRRGVERLLLWWKDDDGGCLGGLGEYDCLDVAWEGVSGTDIIYKHKGGESLLSSLSLSSLD